MKVGLVLAVEAGRCDFPPLGIGYLVSSIRHSLPHVEVIISETIDDLLENKPDIIGISASTDTYYIAVKWARRIKEIGHIPIILGGIHISLIPESLESCFDVAVIGEGEVTIVELIQSYLRDGAFKTESLKTIQGLAFFLEEKLHLTSPRPIIQNLDLLPSPNRHELPFYQRGTQSHIFSARGCPYDCNFCASSKFFQSYRSLSVEKIIEDIDFLINAEKSPFIVFYDDLFIARKSRLQEIIHWLKSRRLIGKCQFMGHIRANLVDNEVCLLLKELGMNVVSIGLESFSDRILKYYNKRAVNSEVNQRALDLLTMHGINVLALFMFGAPIETESDVNETLEKICRNIDARKLSDGQWGMLLPYPGTKVWDWASAQGIVNAHMDWEKFSGPRKQELYLGQRISQSELRSVIQDWKVKFTLMTPNRNPNQYTNLFINNETELQTSMEEILKRRHADLGSRYRDDVLIQAARKKAAPNVPLDYPFIKNFAAGRLTHGKQNQCAIWSVVLNGMANQAILLHPPAKLVFDLPIGDAGEFNTAIALHPDTWNKPETGIFRFLCRVDGNLVIDQVLDPIHRPEQRCWHEFIIPVGESETRHHIFEFETQATGSNLTYGWTLWREPMLCFSPYSQEFGVAAPPRLEDSSMASDSTDQVSIHIEKALEASTRNDPETARKNLQSAHALSPEDCQILFALGQAKQAVGDIHGALDAYTKVLQLDTNLPEAHSAAALAYQLLGNSRPAEAEANQALILQPDDPVALKVLARISLNRQHYEAARLFCQKILAQNQEDPDVLVLLRECSGEASAESISDTVPRRPATSAANSPAARADPIQPVRNQDLMLLGNYSERCQSWRELGAEHILQQFCCGGSDTSLVIKNPAEHKPPAADGFPAPPPDLTMGYGAGNMEIYFNSGRRSYDSLTNILTKHEILLGAGDALLDWGCASGRVLRNFIVEASCGCRVWGGDVHSPSIEWAKDHLTPPFQFFNCSNLPHLPFPDGYFKFIYALSVFTHLVIFRDLWLLELSRILSKDGLMILTIHDENSWEIFKKTGMPGWVPIEMRNMDKFPGECLEIRGSTWEYCYTFFHSDYIRRVWGQYFRVVDILPQAEGYQTAVVLQKAD